MTSRKLLLIDDDIKLGNVLTKYIEKFNFNIDHATHPKEGLKLLCENDYKLIILDIMLPDMDGLEVCREIRKNSQVPILFLSARGDTMDRIVGLEVGGDDYLPKPFEPRELIARIESILRRSSSIDTQTQFDGLKLNKEKMTVELDGQQIELTSMEFMALHFLIEHRSKIISRDDLISELQGMDVEVYGRSIDILMSRLRNKLNDDTKSPKYIKTVRGQGYRFVGGEVEH